MNPGENHRPVESHSQTLSHIVVSSTPCLRGIRTYNVNGCTDCICILSRNVLNDIRVFSLHYLTKKYVKFFHLPKRHIRIYFTRVWNRPRSCALCCLCLCIIYSWLPLRFSLTFILSNVFFFHSEFLDFEICDGLSGRHFFLYLIILLHFRNKCDSKNKYTNISSYITTTLYMCSCTRNINRLSLGLVPYVAYVSVLYILDCHFGFL
jgi:hypothetical protein